MEKHALNRALSARAAQSGRGRPNKPKRGSLIVWLIPLTTVTLLITLYVFCLSLNDQVLGSSAASGVSDSPMKSIHRPASHVEASQRPVANTPSNQLPSSTMGKVKANTGTTSLSSSVPSTALQSLKNLGTSNPMRVQSNKANRIAFAITITKDGNFQDGAAVLAYSIYKAFRPHRSSYKISLVAFVHPDVHSSRAPLSKLGYHVIECPVPVNVSAIFGDFLREKINKNGCCGAAELIKLNSYRLTQYARVVHLDADVLLYKGFPELFSFPHSLIYTTDPNMATHKGPDKQPVQGGFIVIKPDLQDYTNLVDIVMTIPFYKGGAWNRSRIGWFWGGMTVQGVLPYYYNRAGEERYGRLPNRTLVLDRCIYNSMADSDPCVKPTLQELVSAHFTVCQKPWTCYGAGPRGRAVNRLCGELHEEWFRLRSQTETFFGLPADRHTTRKTACKSGGHFGYVPIPLHLLEGMPASASDLFLPDDSPDRILPTEAGRFRKGVYY